MCNQDCGQTTGPALPPSARRAARRGGVLAVMAVLAAGRSRACTPASLHAEPTAVRDIRIATHGDVTRVVIDLNRRVSFRHLSLDEPPRLAIDLPEVAWEVPRLNGRRTVGLVKGLRFGRFRPGGRAHRARRRAAVRDQQGLRAAAGRRPGPPHRDRSGRAARAAARRASTASRRRPRPRAAHGRRWWWCRRRRSRRRRRRAGACW